MIQLFYGVPGAGKTTAMQALVLAQRESQTFFVMDFAGEWGPVSKDDPDKPNPAWRGVDPEGWLHIVDEEMVERYREGGALDWMTGEDPWPPGVYLFQWPWEGEEVAELAKGIGDVVYVDDEIDRTAIQGTWLDNPLRDFVHRGRHMPNNDGIPCELHIMGACRRPQNLATDLTSMADEVYIFRVQGHRTFKRLVDDNMIDQGEIQPISLFKNFQCKLWKSTGESALLRIENPYGKQTKAKDNQAE